MDGDDEDVQSLSQESGRRRRRVELEDEEDNLDDEQSTNGNENRGFRRRRMDPEEDEEGEDLFGDNMAEYVFKKDVLLEWMFFFSLYTIFFFFTFFF